MTVRAIYENGVFRPVDPVSLPEKTPVEVTLPEMDLQERMNQQDIFVILRKNFPSGEADVAARHNEHQP